MKSLHADIVVIGASLGGVLAAASACRAGARVCLVAQHPWLGGQMTAQAVPPDEHPLIESGGASASYRGFREDLRALVRAQPGFLDRATLTPSTNPGDGWVSRLCTEPAHAAAWFERLLAPQVAAGHLRLLRAARPIAATRAGRLITEVVVESACRPAMTSAPQGVHSPAEDPRVPATPSEQIRLRGQLFIDATDTGELLRLADLPYRLGKEAHSEFGEADAPAVANRLDQQPVTHVMALRWQPQPGPILPAPPSYAFWRAQGVPHHAHALFSPHLPGRERGSSATLPFTGAGGALDWWRYRRIVSGAQWAGGRADVSLVNWAQNDFALCPLLDGPKPQHEVEAAARELSLCLLHWLQTKAPRPDGQGGSQGFPEWQLATDILGTADGLAQQTYVRESRRIVARSTLHQSELLDGSATARHDSAGVGWYNLDIHPTCVSGHSVNARVAPFTLPLGSFIPLDCDNLLPGCKNLGVTHLANACTRVHPVEWLTGEVAGLLAAHALAAGRAPAACLDSPARQAALQMELSAAGIPLAWPAAVLARAGHNQFTAH